ncbi:PAS domain S-box protein [Mesonia maritima]
MAFGVQLVPNGVIKYVYPFEENKAALNLDVLNSATTSKEALKAIERHKIYFAGPLQLKQGGVGIVGRLPVFIENEFWGFSGVIIKLERLIRNSGISNFEENYRFQLSKVNPVSGKEEFFLEGAEDINLAETEKITIEDGDWNIYISSLNEHEAFNATLPVLILGFLLACVCATITVLVFKRPGELQQLVEVQTGKLLTSELKFKAIFDQAGLGIVHLTADHGKFIEVNKRFCDKLMLTASELKERNFFEFIEGDAALDKNLLEHQKVEVKLIRNDGMPIYVRLTNSPFSSKKGLSYITIVEDITEKKKTRQHLKELKTRMEMAIRVSKLAYWEWNVETDEITWSARMYEIFGVSKDQELGSSLVLSHVYPKDLKKYKRYTKRLLEGDTLKPYEVRIHNTNGGIIYILAHVESEINEKGKVIKLKGSLLDVSKEKRAEKELNHSYKLVLEQNKRLLNFSYIISHNLRSHSSNIQALLNLLGSTSVDEEQKEMLNMLTSVSKSLDETLYDLNDVVNIQKNTTISTEPLLVKKYVDRVLSVLSSQIRSKKVKITLAIPEEAKINFNPAYFESILLNFISNAIRYRHPERIPEITIRFEIEEELKKLSIQDNGIGIDLSKYGEKLFGMYKTFTDHPDSRGMGLFMSKSQLEVLGGKVSVESEVGKGSTFTLYFK